MSIGEDFSQLKVGDLVVLHPPAPQREMTKATVERITTTQIVVNSMHFRKTDGFQVGRDYWHRWHISLLTPAMEQTLTEQGELRDR